MSIKSKEQCCQIITFRKPQIVNGSGYSSGRHKAVRLSGDVQANPGLIRYPEKSVRKNQLAICRDTCDFWYHIGCIDMDRGAYEALSAPNQRCHCTKCITSTIDQVLIEEENRQNKYDELKTKLEMSGLKLSWKSEIKFLLMETKLDIHAITKSHLRPEVKDEQIQIAGYNKARKDKATDNNCQINFSDTLTAFEREDLYTTSDIEQIWIDITISSQKLLVGSVYRPPHDITFYEKLSI
eukprot:gene13178-3979_t